MKRYELYGVIKDGNKRIGFIVMDFANTKLECSVLSSEVVLNLASQNMVRYVMTNNNQLICLLTDEEMNYRASRKLNMIKGFERTYLTNLPSIKLKYMDFAMKNNRVCMSCVSAYLTTNGLSFMLCGSREAMQTLCGGTLSRSISHDMWITYGVDYAVCFLSVPVMHLDELKNLVRQNSILCDFSCVKHRLRGYKSEIIDKAVNDLVNVNLSLERRLL